MRKTRAARIGAIIYVVMIATICTMTVGDAKPVHAPGEVYTVSEMIGVCCTLLGPLLIGIMAGLELKEE